MQEAFNMKRIAGLILVFCLVLSVLAGALAAPKWEITQEPQCKTTKKSIVLSIKVKGKPAPKYQWWFVNPDNPEEKYSGKKLNTRFKGIKVKNPGSATITLTKVPEELHGWYAYCHLYGNAYKMDSGMVAVQVYGLDPAPEPENQSSGSSGDGDGGETAPASDSSEGGETGEDGEGSGEGSAENEPVSEDFTVTANGKYLYKIDSMGNPDGSEAASSLTFTGTGNVAVSSEEPFKSWTVNGVRFEPDNEISGFKLFNLSSDTSVSLKTAVKTAASAQVDESVTCNITCTGCSFTYIPKGLKSVKEGVVPSGAVIYVFADSSESAVNGYSINGGEPQNPGSLSVQVTVTGDTTIVVR